MHQNEAVELSKEPTIFLTQLAERASSTPNISEHPVSVFSIPL